MFLLFPVLATASNPLLRATSFTLDNGLTVVLYPDHRAQQVHTELWYRVGALDETLGKGGLAHAFEHLMFRGTKRWPGDGYTRQVRALGGSTNAWTSADFTWYVNTVPSRSLDAVLEMEADRMRNLTIDEKTMRTELQVILEERRMRIDNNAQQLAIEQLQHKMYGKHRWADGVIGSEADLQGLTIGDFRGFYDRWYHPNNATLVIAGDVDPATVKASIQRYFGAIKATTLAQREPLPQPIAEVDRKQVLKASAPNSMVMLSWRLPAELPGTDRAALRVLAEILNGGAREQGLRELSAGQWGHYSDLGRDVPVFTYGSQLRRGKKWSALQSDMLRQIRVYQGDSLYAEDVEIARKKLPVHKLFSYDGLNDAAAELGLYASLGRSVADEVAALQQLSEVSRADVIRVAEHYLTDDTLAVVVVDAQSMDN
ncbi:M16 family metallopeptidase [Chitinolyticbacter albus]|uniref:M16 family metallopeptidase n=1 Tax=Chitinolyticbacter albus TaxID=2961951 RepID=UPI002108717F|nr:pitrilysin family protein [Chitinolyticbacter albus]